MLTAIRLRNFRCHSEALFEFSPGINLICGPNAKGKTSLLEAIYLLIAGRSFRTAQLQELILFESPGFHVEAFFVKHGVHQSLSFHYSSEERRIHYNSTSLSSIANLIGLLPGVSVTPDDVALVKGSPMARRHFLDLQISQIDPLYVHHLTRYHRALRQRNILLRAKEISTIESWEAEMAHSAAYVTQQRSHALRELQEKAQRLHQMLSAEKEQLSLGYKPGVPVEGGLETIRQLYLKQFVRYRPRELAFGATLTGPQKDDFAIALNQREARFFGSEGQQRSCATALRLAEWERVFDYAEVRPLMLMDDVGVSLDDARRSCLLNYTPNLGQVFLTTTQEISVPAHIIRL